MKKLLLFFIALFVFALLVGGDLYALADDFDGDYVAYGTDGEGTPVFSVNGESVYAVDYVASANIIGETIILSSSLTEREILKKLYSVYHFHADLDGITIIYGFSPRLKRIIFMDGKPVNYQITISDDAITVSSPVNCGSF